MWIILVIVSLGANIYLGYEHYQYYLQKESEKRYRDQYEVNSTQWKEGLEIFKNKLEEKYPQLAKKKYYYINTWAIFCAPCIKEMPWLDSLAGTMNKDVAYIFVSDLNEDIAERTIKNKKFNIKNFVFINKMNDFISGICNERKTTTKVFPIQMIIKNTGEPVYYSTGAFENVAEAKEFTDQISKLE